MRFLPVFLFVAVSFGLSAQDRSDFYGTWVNARFLEALQRSQNIADARKAIEDEAPVWISIDADEKVQVVSVSFNIGSHDPYTLEKVINSGKGASWELKDSAGPKWTVTVDLEGHLFIQLRNPHNASLAPIVLTRIPSRLQDPEFHISQIITKAILTGAYTDNRGVSYLFNQDMTAEIDGKPMRFKLKIDGNTNSVFILMSDVLGTVSPYLVQRTPESLVLTDGKGKKTILKIVGRKS